LLSRNAQIEVKNATAEGMTKLNIQKSDAIGSEAVAEDAKSNEVRRGTKNLAFR
jgi:hypothetical protein